MVFLIDIVPKAYDFGCQALLFHQSMKSSYCLKKKRLTTIVPFMFNEKFHSNPTTSGRMNPVIMVNGCTGKMGRAVIEAANFAGVPLVDTSFGREKDSGSILCIDGKKIKIYGPSEREIVLASLYKEFPHMIVIDYTVPDCVNDNVELYCKVGVPFVMGTTGGHREKLYRTVEESNVYAVISPQMGKQVVAFLAAMEIMAEQFPGAFAGYSLEVTESHQSTKIDTSGTAKAIVKCFNKLGIEFKPSQIMKIRDPNVQVSVVGVPDEYLRSHAFHIYRVVSPDDNVVFQFLHNVCGRKIYADGTIDAARFLSRKVWEKAEKKIYNMIDVMGEGKYVK